MHVQIIVFPSSLSFSKAPYLPRPFDATDIRSTLTQNDVIEIGEHYDRGAVPNADYIFYGSNLSEFVPSFDGIDANNELKNPSLYDSMQNSAGINERSITFDSTGRVFVSRSRDPELMSESMEGFESNVVGDMSSAVVETRTCEVVRKDLKFRWSILSNESGVASSAVKSRATSFVAFTEFKALDEAEIKVESDREGKEKGQEQNLDSKSKPDTLSVVEIIEETETGHGPLDTKQDILQAEQHIQSRLQSNYQLEFTTPLISPTTTFSSPPCQKVIHCKGKLRMIGLSGSITKFHVLTNVALLSPLKSGHNNQGSSSCETAAPSSLGFWHGGEPDDNQTSATTLDSSIAPLLEVSLCDGSPAKSETVFSVDDTYSGGRQDDFSDTSSTLGELDINRPLPFLSALRDKEIHGKDNETRPVDKIVSIADDIILMTIRETEVDDPLATVHESLCTSVGIVDNAFALIRKVTQLLSNCVKIIFCPTCLRPKRCSLV